MGKALTVVALVLVAISGSAGPAAADYLQYGVEAARTGWVKAEGPSTDDVAFTVKLPGSRAFFSTPLIVGRHAYVATVDLGVDPTLVANAVYRIDLDTASVETFLQLPDPPRTPDGGVLPPGLVLAPNIASDGSLLFVSHAFEVWAVPLGGGEPLWTWDYPPFLPDPAGTICADPAVRGATLYLGCTQVTRDPSTPNAFTAPTAEFGAAIDVTSGKTRWAWGREASAEAVGPDAPASACENVPGAGCSGGRIDTTFGISVVGPYVVLVTQEFAWQVIGGGVETTRGLAGTLAQLGPAGRVYELGPSSLWVLAEDDGSFLWRGSTVNENQAARWAQDQRTFFSYVPTGTETHLFAQLGVQRALNPALGEVIWEDLDLGAEDPGRGEGGGTMVLRGDQLFVTTRSSLYRYDEVYGRHERTFLAALDPSGLEGWGSYGLLATNDTVFGRTVVDVDGAAWQTVTAFDAGDGRALWSRLFAPGPLLLIRGVEFAISGDVLVVASQDGNVTVVGETAASPRPVADVGDEYPPPGEQVTVDLSRTEPGLFGPATAFRAEWGDGAVTEWTPDARMRHAYAAARDHTARFQARNDANQTASTFVTFHVGGTPPQELNLAQRAFKRENQDLLFGSLGLMLALAGGAIGVARVRRRHDRLRRELAAVDAVFARTRADPFECEAALRERRAHAHALLVDGVLDEAQFAVLRDRIDELATNVRLGALDERFQYLPLGMVEALRGMLADGRIERWERDHFLLALENDRVLTGEQKEKVRALIDGWFVRDAGRS